MAFVIAERQRYEGDANNRVAYSLSQVGRYLRFVEIARARHKAVSDQVVVRFRRMISETAANPGTRELTAEEVADLEKDSQLQVSLHFEMESVLIFAKILLDKIAQFIEDFFGIIRGSSLRSHDR